MAGVVAGLAAGIDLLAAEGLTPIDEAGFRKLVDEHRGRVLLIDFWATWCAPCREEMPKLVALHSRYAKEMDFFAISCDEPEAAAQAAKFVAANGVPTPRYIRQTSDDDHFINAIDPKWSGALPALFLFDRAGRQIKSFVGESDMRQVEAAVRQSLAD